MRFQFTAPDAEGNGLKLIPELPDIKLCRIEGRNGIGKTLAARLLELASGFQPYAALPHAWSSLVSSLGRVEIRIDGFDDDVVIKCVLDSNEWLGRSAADCALKPGAVYVNDSEVAWAEARKLFQVRRIAGDEGLQETLGRLLRERSLEADSKTTTVGETLASWSDDLRMLQELTRDVSATELVDRRTSARMQNEKTASLRRELSELAATVQESSDRAARYSKGINVANQLPKLIDEYSIHRKNLDNALLALEDEDKQLALTASSGPKAAERSAELSKWTRRFQLRLNALNRANDDILRFSRIADLGHESSSALSNELTRRIAEIDAEIELSNVAGTLRASVTELTEPLVRLGERAVVDQIFATLDRPVTGKELRSALLARRAELMGIPKPDQVQKLETERERIYRRLNALRSLPGLERTKKRKQDLVGEAEAKWQDLVTTNLDVNERRSVLTRLSNLRSVLTAESSETGRIGFEIAQLLGIDATTLGIAGQPDAADSDAEDEENLDESAAAAVPATVEHLVGLTEEYMGGLRESVTNDPLLAGLGSLTPFQALLATAAQLAAAEEADQIGHLAEKTEEVAAAENLAVAATERLASLRLRIRASLTSLGDLNGRWGGWVDSFEPLFYDLSNPLEYLINTLTGSEIGFDEDTEALELAAAEGLSRMSTIVEEIEEAASLVRNGWSNVSSYLDATARMLAPRLASASSVPSLTAFNASETTVLMQSWAESELAAVLSTEALRRELFDDAQEVQIDLVELAVLWRTSSGKRRRRPLEAFSSGEQVFAYTRAKLEQLAGLKSTAQRTAIVLDEFGAFVARDRFGELMRYVEQEAIGITTDQIFVMLPLAGIGAMQNSVGDDLGAATQLKDRGYFAVPGIAGTR